MAGKQPSKPKNPQKFKHLALYFHFLGSHGRQGRHRTTPLPSNWVLKTLLKSGALLRDILSDTSERTVDSYQSSKSKHVGSDP